ncbi:MAG TPA: hypothetical protein VMH78_02360 [Thermoplasmata archaeon]|nr:hypothetical protein [Thermoplasmata archaeon]
MAYDAADGYVVLYGGFAGISKVGIYDDYLCLNDTWVFKDGVWANLSIAGPPSACAPSMAYDASDGYVVEYGGFQTTAQDHYTPSPNNETWTFEHGRWTELVGIPNPWVEFAGASSVMTYDPALGSVILYGEHFQNTSPSMVGMTWGFNAGFWSRIATANDPISISATLLCGLTYDRADGYPVLVTEDQTWGFINEDWIRLTNPPDPAESLVGFSFDAKLNETVLFGAVFPPGTDSPPMNYTWLYADGSWANASVNGPPYRFSNGMVFDGHDGYTLSFGGEGWGPEANNLTSRMRNDTWIFTPPPTVLNVSVSAEPQRICSRSSLGCGLGTDETRVTVTVVGETAGPGLSSGTDEGQGWVAWGPYAWIPQPTVNFVGWQDLVPAVNLGPAAGCTLADTSPRSCVASPAVVSLNGNPAQEVLSWSWNGLARYTSFGVGDEWTISFNEEAVGPPYGLVPLDACITSACTGAGSGKVQGLLSGIVFSPYGNASMDNLSAPLAEVTVMPSPTQSASTGTNSPPPPPAVIPTPLPVLAPPSPVPVATPAPGIPAVVPTTILSGLSLTSLAAGILAAGVTRGVLSRVAHRARVAVPLGRRRAGPRRVRGSN